MGCRLGALIGLGWMAYGLSLLPNLVGVPLGLTGLLIAARLLRGSQRLIAASRTLPAPDLSARTTNRRVWRWFWINFVVEIVLLNVAINLLAEPTLRIYWIPAISLVVGLHFLPMTRIFNVPSFSVCGGAMMVVAAGSALAIRWSAHPSVIVAVEALINASILWTTAAWGVYTANRKIVLQG